MATKRATKKATSKTTTTKKKAATNKKSLPSTREQKLEKILKKMVETAEAEGTYDSLCSEDQKLLREAAKEVGSNAFVGVGMYLSTRQQIPFCFPDGSINKFDLEVSGELIVKHTLSRKSVTVKVTDEDFNIYYS